MTHNESSAPPAASALPPRVARVPFWDNARFVSIFLVVLGHAIQNLNATNSVSYVIYLTIYAFHMPAFAVISGYFSRSDEPTKDRMRRVITDLLLPYLIFETIASIIVSIAQGKPAFNYTQANWTLWFLLALTLFRVVLPYLALVRFPLLVAVGIALIVGYYPNVTTTLALNRALVILPFFVLGWQLKQWGTINRLLALGRRTWVARAVAITLFASLITVIIVLLPYWKAIGVQRWLYMDRGYTELGYDGPLAWLVRLAFFVVAAALILAMLTLIPRSTTWVTRLGQSTMYVYLLHVFVLGPIRDSGVLRGHSEPGYLIVMIIAAVVITVVLALPFWHRLLHTIVEPKPRWLFTRN